MVKPDSMDTCVVESKSKGKSAEVPAIRIDETTVVVTGRWLRLASVQDEEWLEGQVVTDPEVFIRTVREQDLGADIFTFSQKLPETTPNYHYPWEWDNVAVRGIIEIHNDTPTRQGERFAHYGKEFPVVKREYGTFLGSSEWIGAYFGNELIGIIKLIRMGKVASIMQIVTKTKHYDKRPTNILLAKAVEVCQQKAIPYLVYGKFVYGNKTKSSLTEFKRRNGFERIDYPRYYIPLTAKGRMAMRLKLHLGLLGLLPARVISALRELRSSYYRWVLTPLTSSGSRQDGKGAEGKEAGD